MNNNQDLGEKRDSASCSVLCLKRGFCVSLVVCVLGSFNCSV